MTIDPLAKRAAFLLMIEDDDLLEGTECFEVSSQFDSDTLIPPPSTKISIEDSDSEKCNIISRAIVMYYFLI